MAKFQAACAKGHVPDSQPSGQRFGRFAPVFHVAKKRSTRMGHLGANLMETPRNQPDVRQGQPFRFPHLQDFILQFSPVA